MSEKKDRRSLMYKVLYFTKISRIIVCLVNTHILMYFMSNVTTSNGMFSGLILILIFDKLYCHQTFTNFVESL